MKGTTHLVGGVGLGLLFHTYTNYGDTIGIIFMGSILGSLFPDIDHEGLIAKPGKLLRIRSKALRDTSIASHIFPIQDLSNSSVILEV